MKPQAYLYTFQDERNCLVAIESNDKDEYRLGTLFLRHLYLGLNYTDNTIALGQNPQTDDILLEVDNEYKKNNSGK